MTKASPSEGCKLVPNSPIFSNIAKLSFGMPDPFGLEELAPRLETGSDNNGYQSAVPTFTLQGE